MSQPCTTRHCGQRVSSSRLRIQRPLVLWPAAIYVGSEDGLARRCFHNMHTRLRSSPKPSRFRTIAVSFVERLRLYISRGGKRAEPLWDEFRKGRLADDQLIPLTSVAKPLTVALAVMSHGPHEQLAVCPSEPLCISPATYNVKSCPGQSRELRNVPDCCGMLQTYRAL